MTIQNDGKWMCLGSTQHIKTKYGGGYECKIKFSLPEVEGYRYIEKFFEK